jgi:hypothetical protein
MKITGNAKLESYIKKKKKKSIKLRCSHHPQKTKHFLMSRPVPKPKNSPPVTYIFLGIG